jgi:hypothetical protein
MGIDAGVLDGSNEPTIVIGNFSDEMVGVFRHMGHGLFVDRGPASGIGIRSLPTLTFGVLLLDIDLDADLDVVLANGHIIEHIGQLQGHITYRQQPQLFLNDGTGTFEPAEHVPALDQKLVGRGAAYGDYDRDGDLDLLLTENGGPVHLLRNEANPAERSDVHYVRIRLESRTGNRDALGARVVAISGDRRQERRVRTGGSYLSQSETIATFGLDTAIIDTLRIYWPGSGVDVFEGVQADRELLVVEGREPELLTAGQETRPEDPVP